MPMSPPNGHAANDEQTHAFNAVIAGMHSQFTAEQIKSYVSKLEVPFEASVLNWRVTNTSKNGKPPRVGVPYADQRADTDRPNEVCRPAGAKAARTLFHSGPFQPVRE